MAGNLMVKMDPAGNWKPDKAKSAEKIDGMVALAMSLGRTMLAGPIVKPRMTFA
jgi:phage terminase large subunit-like protein